MVFTGMHVRHVSIFFYTCRCLASRFLVSIQVLEEGLRLVLLRVAADLDLLGLDHLNHVHPARCS